MAVVPPGHSVSVYPIPFDRGAEAGPGSIVLGHFGGGTDDPDEVTSVFDAVRAALARAPSPTPSSCFVRRASRIDELFAPNDVSAAEPASGIVWTVACDGFVSILDDPTRRDALVAGFRSFGGRVAQWLVVDREWRSHPPFERALRDMGIDLLQAAADKTFLAEVCRPDGLRVTGFVATPSITYAPDGPPRPLRRAPRFRALALSGVKDRLTPEALQEIHARPFPLLFFVEANRSPSMMSWPSVPAPLLPIFGDLASFERAARETGRTPGSFMLGGLAPQALFAWAAQQGFGVAIGVYPDDGEVQYLPIDPAGIRSP